MVVETAAALRRVRCVIEKQVLSALCFTIVKTKGIVRLSISGQLTGAGYNYSSTERTEVVDKSGSQRKVFPPLPGVKRLTSAAGSALVMQTAFWGTVPVRWIRQRAG